MKQGYLMLEDKLHGEYKQAFEQVEMYSSANLIGVDVDSELMMELLDNMMEAQEAGQPVSTVVGENIEVFCKNFFSEYKAPNRFFDVLKSVYNIAWILFVFGLLDLGLDGENGLFSGNGIIDIGCIVVGTVCGLVVNLFVYFLLRPFVYKYKKIKPAVFQGILFSLLILAVVAAVILSNKFPIHVPGWMSVLITGLYIAVFILVRAVNNRKRYGTLRKPKQETISFKEGIKESLNNELPGDWLKEYEKKNKKREKKGKPLMTETEFLQKLDKQYNYRRTVLYDSLIFGGCTFVAIIIASFGGFESSKDFWIYAGTLVVIEGAQWVFFTKSAKYCSRVYRGMRETMEEENLTLEQYVEKYRSGNESVISKTEHHNC